MTWPVCKIEPTRIWVQPVADFGFEVMRETTFQGRQSLAFRQAAEAANALATQKHYEALLLRDCAENAEGRFYSIPMPQLELWEAPQ